MYNITATAITTQEEIDALCEYLGYKDKIIVDNLLVDNPVSKVEFFQEYWVSQVKALFINAYKAVESKKIAVAQQALDTAMKIKIDQVTAIADQTISVIINPQ